MRITATTRPATPWPVMTAEMCRGANMDAMPNTEPLAMVPTNPITAAKTMDRLNCVTNGSAAIAAAITANMGTMRTRNEKRAP